MAYYGLHIEWNQIYADNDNILIGMIEEFDGFIISSLGQDAVIR